MAIVNRKNVSRTSVRSVRTNVVDTDTVLLNGIVRVVGRRVTPWVGSMTELSTALNRVVRNVPAGWPENPRGLRAGVDRVIAKLRRAGIKTSFGRTSDHSRKRFVTFVR